VGIWTDSAVDNQLRSFLPGPTPWSHTSPVIDLAWCRETQRVASLSDEGRIKVWDFTRRKLLNTFSCDEPAFDLDFSPDGEVLVLRTLNQLRFIDVTHMTEIYRLDECPAADSGYLTVHNTSGRITAEDAVRRSITVWEVDFKALARHVRIKTRRYRNAKVLILGDRGSGKTNLLLSLLDRPFRDEATAHGLRTDTLSCEECFDESCGVSEIREIVLWDRPNQDECDILERIDISDAAGIVVVFDWESASAGATPEFARLEASIRPGQCATEKRNCAPSAILVVGAKCDRSDNANDLAIRANLCQHFSVPKIYSTSAKDRTGIDELRHAIRSSIDWTRSFSFEPAQTFQDIHAFVVERRDSGLLVESLESLSHRFAERYPFQQRSWLLDMFKASIGVLQNLGEVYHLSWSDVILLQPKYFYTYAAALMRAARRDVAEMGRLPMKEIYSGGGTQLKLKDLAETERMPKTQERVLLDSIVHELIKDRLAYELSTDGVLYLVFPSQPTRILVLTPSKEQAAARAEFEGNSQGVYSSLVVRLLGLQVFFDRPEPYRDAAVFKAVSGGSCTLILDSKQSVDRGEISAFFDAEASDLTRKVFLTIVREHIQERALRDTFKWTESAKYAGLSQAETANVFMCYEHRDLSNVRVIAEDLMKRKIVPWIEDVDLKAGYRQEDRKIALGQHRIAVFILSDSNLTDSMRQDCVQFQKRRCRIIPVILPEAGPEFILPEILRKYKPVDFRRGLGLLPFERLAEGITYAAEAQQKESDYGDGLVFLSYSHDDEASAEELHQELVQAGFRVWWDKDILPGEDFKTQLHITMQNVYAVIACFSPISAVRGRSGVIEEIYEATAVIRTMPSNSVYLIPVLFSSCQLPVVRLNDGRFLNDLQFVDLSLENRREQLSRLFESLMTARNQRRKVVTV
jgi:GTPase SAR1 family protein